VPVRVRYWSQAYCRVLFHQDWRLFAPDPPACAASIVVKPGPEEPWKDLGDAHDHFIWQRMCANAARFAEASRRNDRDTVQVPGALSISLERMAEELPLKQPVAFGVRGCAVQNEEIPLRLTPHR
jgi:hypothetical protein